MVKERILSGMRPTGRLHIGNLQVLENWHRLQEDYDCFYFVADWHALTTAYDDTLTLKNNIQKMIADWLAVGIDPAKSTIFVQSRILEHAELHLLFSMFVPLSWLERVPTYKDQIQHFKEQGKDIMTYGFLGYPLLQAADILIYRADAVPVGEDQLPHVEMCREIARRFNFLYQRVFPEPRAELANVSLLPGIDGRKMSKSYDNEITLAAETKEIKQRVNAMITDPARIHKTDPGHPEVCVVHKYHGIYNLTQLPEIEEKCRAGKIGCVACKKELMITLETILAPIREKRREILSRPGYIDEILHTGTKKAHLEAVKTMTLVREAMHI